VAVSDVLETIFKASGVDPFIGSLSQVADTMFKVAKQQDAMTDATTSLARSMSLLVGPLTQMTAEFKIHLAHLIAVVANTRDFAASEGIAAAATALFQAAVTLLNTDLAALIIGLGAIAGAIAGVVALTALIGKGFKQFGTDTEDVFKAAVILRNRGMEPMIKTLQELGKELQRNTAIDDEAVVGLGGLLAQFGVSATQIPAAVKAIVDANQAGKGSLDELGRAFGRALQGGGRGAFLLRRIGIEFKQTGDRVADTNTLIKDFNSLFGGAAASRRNTPQGAFEAFQEAFANFMSAIGRIAAPAIVVFLNELTNLLNFLTTQLERFAAYLERIGVLAPLNPAAGVGGGRALAGDETLSELQDINRNTKQMLDAIVKQVIGGPGTIAREAGNTLAIRRALSGTTFF